MAPRFVTGLVSPWAASALPSPGYLLYSFLLIPCKFVSDGKRIHTPQEKRPNTIRHVVTLDMELQPGAGCRDSGVISNIYFFYKAKLIYCHGA